MKVAAKHKRCRRFNDAGHAHVLTFSCFHGQPFFSKNRTCQWMLEAIGAAREKHSFHVWAYVIMPEHVHLLIWPREHEYNISTILSAIKLPVTRRALAFVKKSAPHFLPRMLDRQPNGNQSYRFWQRGGGYDRNITEPTTLWAEIDYIHANPVRRGLCQRPEEWRWSSAAAYAGGTALLSIDRESLPRTEVG